LLPEILNKLANKENLSEDEMAVMMTKIMDGELTPAQVGALLMGLRVKGETSAEIAGGARVMRDKAVAVNTQISMRSTPAALEVMEPTLSISPQR